jgi:hypothetical protein
MTPLSYSWAILTADARIDTSKSARMRMGKLTSCRRNSMDPPHFPYSNIIAAYTDSGFMEFPGRTMTDARCGRREGRQAKAFVGEFGPSTLR